MTTRPTGGVQYDNRGRVVIVSGGANGIGLAICRRFVESGASVVCFDVQEERPPDLPADVDYRVCDVSSESACRDAVAWAASQHGAIDILVNNAAIQPAASYCPLHELPMSVWHDMLAVNLSGYTYLAKYVLDVMTRQRSGVIVNIASAQGHRTARQVGVYGPIKAANILQARQWGIEYARDGVRVVSVSPGAIDTPLLRATLEKEGGQEVLANRHPVGRLGQPEEVAYAVLWLASPDASFITATDLEVDGGLGGFAAFAEPYRH